MRRLLDNSLGFDAWVQEPKYNDKGKKLD